jgi:hypothetical protein
MLRICNILVGRAQVAFEYFVLIAILLLVSAGVLMSYRNLTESTISSFQAESSVSRLKDEIVRLHDLGHQSSRTIRLEIPENVVSNRTFLSNNTVQISYYSNTGLVDVFESVDFNVSGSIPNTPGIHWVKLSSNATGALTITVLDFDYSPKAISLYLVKFDEEEYNVTVMNTGNETLTVNLSTQGLDYLVDLNASTQDIDNETVISDIGAGGQKTIVIRIRANKNVGNYYGGIVIQSSKVSSNIAVAVGIRNRIFPVNTTIIPLDGNQADILHAYGFAYDLLSQDIPVGWIMDNITINTTEMGQYNYDGSVFVIDYADNPWLTAQASTWGVTLHHINQTLNGDFVTWLAFAPRVVVHNGGKYWVITNTLNASGIPYNWTDPALIMNGDLNNYDVVLIGHYNFQFNSPDPQAETDAIEEFVMNGGYLHAECISVTTYEQYQNSTGVRDSFWLLGANYLNMYEPRNPLTQTWGTPSDIGGLISGFDLSNANVTLLADNDWGLDKFVYSEHGEGYISYFAGHLGDDPGMNVSRMRLLDNVVLFTSAEKGKTGPLP